MLIDLIAISIAPKKAFTVIISHPRNLIFLIAIILIFIAGTILIVKSEKNFFAEQLQRCGIEKTSNKYKIIENLLTVLIILFYIVDIPTILVFSFFLFGEIKTMNDPNPLPSSLNMGIESMVLYWIICIIPFIIITVLIVKNNKKKR